MPFDVPLPVFTYLIDHKDGGKVPGFVGSVERQINFVAFWTIRERCETFLANQNRNIISLLALGSKEELAIFLHKVPSTVLEAVIDPGYPEERRGILISDLLRFTSQG